MKKNNNCHSGSELVTFVANNEDECHLPIRDKNFTINLEAIISLKG